MSKSIIDVPPGKALRLGLRLPIWLYRLHLGWLLGERFLLLTHIGRSSGLTRQAVIEVVGHDKETYYVVSGWGKTSDWYQNVRNAPSVMIQVAERRFRAYAEFLSPEAAIPILAAYARKHQAAFRKLTGLFLGRPLEAGTDAARQLAEKMPMIAFHLQ